MAKRKRRKKKKENFLSELSDSTIRGIISVLSIVVAIILVMAARGYAGMVGDAVYKSLDYLLGASFYLLPITLILVGISIFKTLEGVFSTLRKISSFLFFISGVGLVDIIIRNEAGLIGNLISKPLLSLFDFYVSLIILLAIIIVSFFVLFDIGPGSKIFTFWRRNRDDEERDDVEDFEEDKDNLKLVGAANIDDDEEEPSRRDATKKKGYAPSPFPSLTRKKYEAPSIDLLEGDSGKPSAGDIKANALVIQRTLQNFGITVEMDEVTIGPSVTRYALKPAEGVKLSRIVALQNDLSLALATHPLRIEAPIPGKSLVGIELPNNVKTTVGLGTMIGSNDFQDSNVPLTVTLGKGVSGKMHFANLAKMPHMLIAGTTGSGKSVTIHSLITSLLYRNPPENLKFILIDPKRVELTLYNKIPHLLTPVITDPKKAILSLKWLTKEMERRYNILETESCRDIGSYHKNVLEPAYKKLDKKKGMDESEIPEQMPYIVVIIDELADIMSTYPRELESSIVRLAQMSRAVGIHLVLSTQRPSVNVITGLIKANIPARIALQVSSQVDSRTILDTSGAEKLLGAGDMLYLSGDMGKPVRIQSPFVTEPELKSVVKHLKDAYKDELNSEIDFTENSNSSIAFDEGGGDEEDDLYEEARQEVIRANKASTSYLQRKFRIGYSRAARLIDMLEERGVVGPGEGSRPRPVLEGNENEDEEIDEDTE